MPIEDVFDEARRVIDAAAEAGVPLRAAGGVGVGLVSPSARKPPLQRSYGDIDFVGRSRHMSAIESVFERLGYVPERAFNDLHGQRRLFFNDPEHGREADVFLDGIRACHDLELHDRLALVPPALSPADLLLSKLQVIETNFKDFQDAIAVVSDHPVVDDDDEPGIALSRLTQVCCSDWGWWRTVTMVCARAVELAERLAAAGEVSRSAPERLTVVLAHLEHAPKTRRWRLRARVGDRIRWHEEPEGLEHASA